MADSAMISAALPCPNAESVDVIPNKSLIDSSQARFLLHKTIPLKKLSGFKKTHSVPAFSSPAARSFVGKLVQSTLRDEFQTVHKMIRKTFGLKRTDIEVTIDSDGAAILETNLLRLQKEYWPDSQSPESVHCRTCIDAVSDLNILADPIFEDDFPFRFSCLEIATEVRLDIESLIDRLELVESDNFELDYNFEGTECEIRLPSLASRLLVFAEKVSLESDQAKTGPFLIKEFAEYQSFLSQALAE